jgi:para-aminobenzoate synthetase
MQSQPSPPPLPRTLILDYYDSCKCTHLLVRTLAKTTDTNNLLTLFTQLYPDHEVLRKVVVVKADKYSWYVRDPDYT